MKKLLVAFVLWTVPAFAQDHPKFFITPQREVVWAGLKTAASGTLGWRIYSLVKANADGPGRYAITPGMWEILMYHWTQDPAYGAKTWTRLTTADGFLFIPNNCTALGGNYSRENFEPLVWIYDWLYVWMTPAQRTQFLDKLNAMAACISFRPDDSDQNTGDYFGVAMLYVSTASYNPPIVAIWNDASKKFGGLTATAADGTTMRNAIKWYVEKLAPGGEWLESAEYNRGTTKLLVMGADAIKTWTGVDSFPEVTAWAQQAAGQIPYEMAPGIEVNRERFSWGDEEHPHEDRAFYEVERALTFAGLAQGTPEGARLQDWIVKYIGASGNVLDTWPRGFLFFDPNAPRVDYTTAPKVRFAQGQGRLHVVSGWGPQDAAFTAHFPPIQAFTPQSDLIDHGANYFGDIGLWKNGGWVLTHPLAYGGPPYDSRGANSLTIGGISAYVYRVREYAGPISQENGTGYSYIAQTTGGAISRDGYYNLHPTWIQEQSRSIVYLPDTNTIVVHDRVNAKKPTVTPLNPNGWDAAVKAWSDTRINLKEMYIHTPVSPTLGTGFIEWPYAGANKIRATSLLPVSANRVVEDESVVYSGTYYSLGYWVPTEKKWHAIISPSAYAQWDTFLTVYDPYGAGSPQSVTLVQDVAGKVDAALVGGTLLVFNATPGADLPDRTVPTGGGPGTWVNHLPATQAILDVVRTRKTNFALSFTAMVPTKVLMFDLDTTKTWAYNGTPITVSALGVGQVTVPAGAVSLGMTMDGSVPTPPPVNGCVVSVIVTTTCPKVN